MNPNDTIAAISTPLGEGGLAVVRLSGPRALAIADTFFTPIGRQAPKPSAAASHTLHLGRITLAGRVVDEVLLAVMRAPRTYTREDVVEISCHGGLLPAKLVLDAVLAAGARPAEPGEFTKRAFLNGRLDLAQAEAVADLIHSRTELALRAAHEQLAGALSQRIRALRDHLMHVLAHVEAQLDFPDEDIAPETQARLLERLDDAQEEIRKLLLTAPEGQLLRRGVRAAIVGRPNVGKSSLLNQLLGRDRAIVSPLPGTTRDTIEETANIRGLPIVFIDTAGLRESDDELEREGMRRSRAALDQAELIVHVLDASAPLTAADQRDLAGLASRKRIIVLNKSDLPLAFPADALPADTIRVSCLTGAGIEALKDRFRDLLWTGQLHAGTDQVTINVRHEDALRRAAAALEPARQALRAGVPLDLVALDLRTAVNAVGEIVGQTATEDLLDSIFRQFCIGK
ncbi:MAG: tRNA uridine-5-carboxymethylaminomethyl(34) synthesis GTPase MnmE [Verrucomicrobia bacterium]|nr:tRNA uridine-5-carboxymethylaminomethyl(34) synthesis GTPase MnmE [Verrucomicrobiota bacterium]